ncbi:FecR domain-containing protein [uncultured Dechloromonas sp.]|uniref:FecR family protein n=1 Tax=uncultured Dechloromonas sp. TaxID=171719 RepID=UPI0025DAEE9C|nr:FecR domain-containing protein [uncultured Dechloromonas sp.]
MIRSHWALAGAAAVSILASSPLWAEQAGMVKVSKGAVSIEREGRKLAAGVGTPVQVADRVRTGPDGSVGVTLRDNTLLSAGPNSLIVIDRFAYDSVTQEGKISVGVRKGTLAVASGRIAKRTPESVDFHTPTSILGVRGTEFVIEVEGDGDE